MESLLSFICEHAEYAHYIFFGLLMLAGLNVPISEDLILLSAGAITATCVPENYVTMLVWLYLGCWISAWEAYAIGRFFGPKLYDFKWFSHFLTRGRIERLHHYYERFGIFTFILGRFIPGGVRNTLFMTAGLGKMHFGKFIFRDGIACFISTNTLFYLGFLFGENYSVIVNYFTTYTHVFLGLIAILIAALFARIKYRSHFKKEQNN